MNRIETIEHDIKGHDINLDNLRDRFEALKAEHTRLMLLLCDANTRIFTLESRAGTLLDYRQMKERVDVLEARIGTYGPAQPHGHTLKHLVDEVSALKRQLAGGLGLSKEEVEELPIMGSLRTMIARYKEHDAKVEARLREVESKLNFDPHPIPTPKVATAFNTAQKISLSQIWVEEQRRDNMVLIIRKHFAEGLYAYDAAHGHDHPIGGIDWSNMRLLGSISNF